MIFVYKLPINKIKGYLFSILALSEPSSGSPYRVCQIRALIKTEKNFVADTEKILGLISIYFHAKTILYPAISTFAVQICYTNTFLLYSC
jgi:hypothetical protein